MQPSIDPPSTLEPPIIPQDQDTGFNPKIWRIDALANGWKSAIKNYDLENKNFTIEQKSKIIIDMLECIRKETNSHRLGVTAFSPSCAKIFKELVKDADPEMYSRAYFPVNTEYPHRFVQKGIYNDKEFTEKLKKVAVYGRQ